MTVLRGNRLALGTVLVALCAAATGCGGDDGPPPTLDQQLNKTLHREGVGPLAPGPVPDTAKVTLGQALMFDKEISGNRDISCATCHHPLLHTGDGISVSIGTGGKGLGPTRVLGAGRPFIPRNAPEVFVRGATLWTTMFWDGRVNGTPEGGFTSPAGAQLPAGLESVLAVQAMFPVTSRDEMRGKIGDLDVFGQHNEMADFGDNDFTGIWRGLMVRLLAIPQYVTLFNQAYPSVPTAQLGFQHAANAIAAFEIDAWSLLGSPWDQYLDGDRTALSDEAKRGALLFFGKAGCVDCHSGNLLTDQDYHDIAAPQIGPGKGAEAPLDYGRGRETGTAGNRYKFRTPQLRNVALTGPWLHDGAYTTLEGAVRHHLDPETSLRNYDVTQLDPSLRGTFQKDPEVLTAILANLDPLVSKPLRLTDAEVNELLTFLEALTDPAAADLRSNIPDSVPSGLPVRD